MLSYWIRFITVNMPLVIQMLRVYSGITDEDYTVQKLYGE